MITRLTFVHALSPLHAGVGQGAGVIDLPIAREKATGLPFLPGSSLKGTLRSLCEGSDCDSIFGLKPSEVDPNENYASSVQFSDQRLLLLPVRSLAGTFAWVTSPYVLRRLARDIEDIQSEIPADIPEIAAEESCYVCDTETQSDIVIHSSRKVYLEDLDLTSQPNGAVTNWAKWIGRQVFAGNGIWQTIFVKRMCLVHDNVFSFLLDTATEITARIKLQEQSKTVESGGLWYEEALPTETILTGLTVIAPTQAAGKKDTEVFDRLAQLMGKTVQFGGKATVGRGLCRVYLSANLKGNQ